MPMFVAKGAKLKCSMGAVKSDLNVLPMRKVSICGQPQANMMDHKPMINIMPFGQCKSLANPADVIRMAAGTAPAVDWGAFQGVVNRGGVDKKNKY